MFNWFTEIDKIKNDLSLPAKSAEEFELLDKVLATGGLVVSLEALALFRLARLLDNGSSILEVGSYCGASTTAFGLGILNKDCTIYCLDCWKDYQVQDDFSLLQYSMPSTDLNVLESFLANTSFLEDKILLLKGTSQQFKGILPKKYFNLIFIDAAHDYQSVVEDIGIALSSLAPGGLLIGHDYHSYGHGVINAVNDLIADNPAYTVKGLIPNTSIWYVVT